MTPPAMTTPFAPCAFPESETPETRGPRTSAALPATLKPPSFVTAWAPRPSAAAFGVGVASSRIVPPFSASAVAATETPSASVSA